MLTEPSTSMRRRTAAPRACVRWPCFRKIAFLWVATMRSRRPIPTVVLEAPLVMRLAGTGQTVHSVRRGFAREEHKTDEETDDGQPENDA